MDRGLISALLFLLGFAEAQASGWHALPRGKSPATTGIVLVSKGDAPARLAYRCRATTLELYVEADVGSGVRRSVRSSLDGAPGTVGDWWVSKDGHSLFVTDAEDYAGALEKAHDLELQFDGHNGRSMTLRFDVRGFCAARSKVDEACPELVETDGHDQYSAAAYLEVDELPKPIFQVPLTDSNGTTGTTAVTVLVGTDGTVLETRPVRPFPIPPNYDSAVESVRKWKFSPATKDGKPVAIWMVAKVATGP